GRVPVGIVNLDRGGAWGKFGRLFANALIPDPSRPVAPAAPSLQAFAVRPFPDEAEARRRVERESLFAALIIPADFSEALTTGRATVEVCVAGPGNVLGTAFTSVVETVANLISSGEIAARTTIEALLGHPAARVRLRDGRWNDALTDLVRAAASPDANPIRVQRLSPAGPSARIKLAHYLAASLAVMFIGFTALMISAGLFQDRRQGTLQRLLVTPTRPEAVLGGKFLGAYLSAVVQLGLLAGGLAALERLFGGAAGAGSGATNPLAADPVGLAVLILTAAAAAAGVGAAVAGLAGSYVQAANAGIAILIVMGLLGGSFFPVDFFPAPLHLLSRATFQYWAVAGYVKLALGSGPAAVLPHALVLTAMAVAYFAIGGRLLKRRLGNP
ncbi:MAG: ABC-2 transporter permease, partial [Candidatus Aminicenantes bacterium]|nr:ABC-2 transporter permease [Candidatus Aminicenantes bacterium]